ncbi:MAG: hypothetical protein HZA50_00815 [Planctomycetes bacterium]|nr:hypothetical protein [Planctomycetota bacterium]
MIAKDNKYYVRYRGGGPVNERQLHEISQQQVATYEKYRAMQIYPFILIFMNGFGTGGYIIMKGLIRYNNIYRNATLPYKDPEIEYKIKKYRPLFNIIGIVIFILGILWLVL